MAGTKTDITLNNSASNNIQEADVTFGEYVLFNPPCSIGKGYGATYVDYPYLSGTNADVEWISKGTKFKKTVDFEKVMPKSKSGLLTFTICDDRVEVRFKPEKP